MATSVREFLETHALHERVSTPSTVGWNGQWPERVEGECRVCNAKRAHRIWPSKVAGVTREWGVYMLAGTGEERGRHRPRFWGRTPERGGWAPKGTQLPAPWGAA